MIEDKTFGLKNKKGGKAQKYIANAEKQVKGGGNPEFRKQELENEKKKKEKELELQRDQELKAMFKAVNMLCKIMLNMYCICNSVYW